MIALGSVSPRGAVRVWERNGRVLRRFALAETGPLIAEPLVVLGAMGLGLGVYVTLGGETSYLAFIAPGIIGGYSLFAAFFECTYGSFTRMEVRRLYYAMITTPLSIEDVITGEVLWGATRSVLSATVVLVVIAVLGFVDSPLALLVPLLALVAGLLFACLGLLFTAIAPTFWTFNYAITLLVMPMYFFSGVFFPLERYPELVGQLAWLLPLTPYVAIVRELVAGHLTLASLWGLLYLLGLLAVLYVIALGLMRRRLIR